MKVNLTIILIQRITHAFDCAFDKSNVCGSHSNANAFTISLKHLNAHSNVQHSNAHSNALACVNKPAGQNIIYIGNYFFLFLFRYLFSSYFA